MKRKTAVSLVAELVTVDDGEFLTASRVEGFPHYWYVTVGREDGLVICGGSAWVVDEASADVTWASASRPPAENCEGLIGSVRRWIG